MAAVAPAAVPTALPLVGPEGVDGDGYPLKSVDRAALRSLLYHREFDALTTYMERLQTDFEADPKKEYWPFDAASSFDTAEPELREPLDAWVAAKPGSAAPLVARGTYFTAVGIARRGTEWAKNTSNADFDAMKDAFAPARADLEGALAIRPNAFPAARFLIRLESASGDNAAARRAADQATHQCPSCFQIRATYLLNSTPRWGGTYEAMTAYAAAAPKATNSRLRFLEGYPASDRADGRIRAKDYDAALIEIERATALGEDWYFLTDRARIERHQKKLDDAKRDIDRALALRPGIPLALFERAMIEDARREWEADGRDLLDGMRIDATDTVARRLQPRAVQGLLSDGVKKWQAGDSPTALRMLDLAADLAPNNGDVQRWRAAVIHGPATDAAAPPTAPGVPVASAAPESAAAPSGDPPEITSAVARANAAPNDFEAHRTLDYALARLGQYDRVVTMWNDYIAAHPKEGRAYLERGGAHIHLRHAVEAKADATKACELGVSEGCARAKQVRVP